MEPDFWHQRWQDKLIGFHQRAINPQLATFWSRLQIKPGENEPGFRDRGLSRLTEKVYLLKKQ